MGKKVKWIEKLSKEDKERLNELLNMSLIHKDAIESSKNSEIAQLWCALLELYKRYERLTAMILADKFEKENKDKGNRDIAKELKDLLDDLETW